MTTKGYSQRGTVQSQKRASRSDLGSVGPARQYENVDEIVKAMRKAGEEIRKDPKLRRKALLATGVYTKSLKLKKRYR